MFLCVYFVHFVVLIDENVYHGKFGSFSPSKASGNRVALPNPKIIKVDAGSFRVSIIHLNSAMDYRIFNVRTYMIILICARVYTLGQLGTPTASQHNIHFDSEKLTIFFFSALLTGFEPRSPTGNPERNPKC